MNERILLVEDDEDLRSLMCEGLRGRGLDVETVDCAQACLTRIDEVGFDVIVTDVEMPGMSGLELCRLLSQRNPPLVAIVVTSLCDRATVTAARENGAFELMSKPILVPALEAAIRRALIASA